MTTFIDTGVLVGAANARDRLHEDAVRVLGELADAPTLTTDHVLVECWAILRNRSGNPAANRFLQGLRGSGLQVEFVGPGDFERALAIAEGWDDQGFSLVDRTSFAVMERLAIARAATFDDDFAIYRYGIDRARAFTIVR